MISLIFLLENATNKCNDTLRGHRESATSLIQLKDGRFITGYQEQLVKIWDLEVNIWAVTYGNSQNEILGPKSKTQIHLLSSYNNSNRHVIIQLKNCINWWKQEESQSKIIYKGIVRLIVLLN